MKKYEKYKDSGIDSIGFIPSHWKITPIKYILEQSVNGIKIGPFGSALTGKVSPNDRIKVYGQWNVIGGNFDAGKNYVSEETYEELSSYWIHPNDILVSMMGTVGKCAIIPKNVQKGIMDSHIVKIRLNESLINPQYFFYTYDKDCSNVVMAQILRDRRGSIMDGLNSSIIKNFKIQLPPLKEQIQIASYLDEKVSTIDKAISEKESLIADLQAYRKTVITEAVTKGLNPNVPMKDSGVEWIGMIPKHWEVMKTSHVYNEIGSGTTPNTSNELYYSKNGINWLQTGDLNDGEIYETSKQITEKAIKECGALRKYSIDSLVIAMYGATIGKIGILKVESTTNQACCVLAKSDLMHCKYAYYSFIASKQQLIYMASGGGQPNISQSIIKEHKLPVPSIKEQYAIISYLEHKDSLITNSISELQSQIDDLKSYKSSIITEAVTGKIDLR